jgi:hypothetical protein
MLLLYILKYATQVYVPAFDLEIRIQYIMKLSTPFLYQKLKNLLKGCSKMFKFCKNTLFSMNPTLLDAGFSKKLRTGAVVQFGWLVVKFHQILDLKTVHSIT